MQYYNYLPYLQISSVTFFVFDDSVFSYWDNVQLWQTLICWDICCSSLSYWDNVQQNLCKDFSLSTNIIILYVKKLVREAWSSNQIVFSTSCSIADPHCLFG